MALVHLYYPPRADPTQPYSSLATLAAFLRRAGISVRCVDFNLGVFEALDAGDLAAVAARNGAPDALVDFVSAELPAARAALRTADTFYDSTRLARAIGVVHRAVDVLEHGASSPELALDAACDSPDWMASLTRFASSDDSPYLALLRRIHGPLASGDAVEPALVGISVTYASQLVGALALARVVRERRPRCRIVLGGAFLSELEHAFLETESRFTDVDDVVLREGESALLALARACAGGAELGPVPNAVRWGPDGRRTNPSRWIVEDVEHLPTPDYSDHPLERYLAPEPVLLVPTDRGCWWGRCAYCTCSVAVRTTYRARPPELVVRDLDALHGAHGVTKFFLAADSMQPKSMLALARALAGRAAPYHWSTNALLTPNLASGDACEVLARGGCRQLWFGMESAVQRVLDAMDKRVARADTFERILARCVRAGISPHLMVMFGFPGERADEAEQTVEFVARHAGSIGSIGCGPFFLQRRSRVQRQPGTYGVRLDDAPARSLRLKFAYEVSAGLTQAQASSVARAAADAFGDVFPFELGTFANGAYSLLYVCRHGRPLLAECCRPRPAPLDAVALERARFRADAWRVLDERRDDPGGVRVLNEDNGEVMFLAPFAVAYLDAIRARSCTLDELLTSREGAGKDDPITVLRAAALLRQAHAAGLVRAQ